MCGIAGIVFADRSLLPTAEILCALGNAIAHRGPDGDGIWHTAGVGLVHRRLSIIDVEGGRQPLGNEDGSIQVVFNGEIYNHERLRQELERKGHRFRTRCDTEVLVHLYEEMGDGLVERLRGMFAFALWDGRRRRLLLARDRVGIKPLYYYRDRQKVVFASELKAILSDTSIRREVDPNGLDEYLTFGFVGGDRSILRNIRKLPAAHTLAISSDDWTAEPQRYWHLDRTPDESRSTDEWLEAVDEKLTETVAAHRISDVPVGAFLSGGIDSSAIVAKWAEAGGRLQTFSIGFEEESFSELPHAARVAREFGAEHVVEVVTSRAIESIAALTECFDEPFADVSAVPMLAVSRLASRSVKVVLSGDGGDEAFGGYARYAHDLREDALRRRMPAWFRRGILGSLAGVWPKVDWLPRYLRLKTALTNLSLSPAAAYANTLSLCRSNLRQELLNADVQRTLEGGKSERFVESAYGSNQTDALNGMLSADLACLLPDDFLTKVDRTSMACGLEVRPPFVDHEFLELTARIPSGLKVRRGQTKWLLKELFRPKLPTGIVDRPKQGFDLPIDAWLRGPLREICESMLTADSGHLSTFIDVNVVRRLLRDHCRGIGRHGRQLWALLVLGTWLDRHLPSYPAGTDCSKYSVLAPSIAGSATETN